MIHAALDQLRRNMEKDRLIRSAELYSEIYQEDDLLKDLAESAVRGWPE